MRSIVVFLALLGLVWGQEGDHCHCEAWATVHEQALVPVWELEPIDIEDCNDLTLCEVLCNGEWGSTTGEGDLETDVDGAPLGQHFCDHLAAAGFEVYGPEDGQVFLYSNLCHGPWVYTGEGTKEPLCCEGGVFLPCGIPTTPAPAP